MPLCLFIAIRTHRWPAGPCLIVDTKRRRDPLGGLIHPSLRCMLVGDAFLGAKTLKTERPTERTDSTYYINAKTLLITVGTGRRAGISDLGLFCRIYIFVIRRG